MKVLYIGGTGEISQACLEQSVAVGHDVSVFNRGRSRERLPAGVTQIIGDLRDDAGYGRLAAGGFDVVCQFLAFEPAAVQRDVDLFAGHCRQYVFISTASAYRKPHDGGAVTEDTPLDNPFWEYSRKKAACESALARVHAEGRLPVTVVRPSHTYRKRFPSTVIDGDHLAWRLLQGKPVLVHDDGESLWTLTHSADFARAFTALLGEPAALGDTFHITSDEAPSWRSVLQAVGACLGREPVIHGVASATLIGLRPEWEGPLLGDKSNSMRFDNAHVRSVIGPWQCTIGLADGLRRVHAHVAERLAAGYRPEPELDGLIDRIIEERQR